MTTSVLPIILAACALAHSPIATAQAPRPSTIRMADLNGDRYFDRIVTHADGTLAVALGLGDRQFEGVAQGERVSQALSKVTIVDLLVADLDDDGHRDLYFVTTAANVALLGDGNGFFVEGTERLGLRDEGRGRSVELVDLDDDGNGDLLLHNEDRDVLFWGERGRFERDATTPFEPARVEAGIDAFQSSSTLEPKVENEPGSAEPAASAGARRPGERDAPRSDPGPRHAGRSSCTVATPSAASADGATRSEGGASDPSPLVATVLGSIVGLSAEQRAILDLLSIEHIPDGLGGTAKTLRLTGANFQIVNGLGATNGNPADPTATTGTTNAMGNLIVGYNEFGNLAGDVRTGSHNIVVGHQNTYTTFGGLVAGEENTIDGPYCAVTGGRRNTSTGLASAVSGGNSNLANGDWSSVSGGYGNVASGITSSVSGGADNLASALFSSASGGRDNIASGSASSVSGGADNEAGAANSSVSGGSDNVAAAGAASISGGQNNVIFGLYASISGGYGNRADGPHAFVGGGVSNQAPGAQASVSGGFSNVASGYRSSVSGGELNSAANDFATVTGGYSNTASGRHGSVSGGQFNQVTNDFGTVTGGGYGNTVSGRHGSVTGGIFNIASGDQSTVSGGNSRQASGQYDWVAGTLFEND